MESAIPTIPFGMTQLYCNAEDPNRRSSQRFRCVGLLVRGGRGSHTKAFVKHVTVYKEYYIELSMELLY